MIISSVQTMPTQFTLIQTYGIILYHSTFPIEVSGAALLAAQCTSTGVGRSDHPMTTTGASSCHHGWLSSGGGGRRLSH